MLFAVLLASFTAAFIGTLSYTRSRRALEAEVRTRLALLAHGVAERLHGELEDRAADITNWAHLEVMRAMLYRDVDKELAQFFEHIVRDRPIYRGILAVDADGHVVASAGELRPALPTAAPPRARISVASAGPESSERLVRLETDVRNPEEPGTTIGLLVVLLDRTRLLDAIQPAVDAGGARPLLIVEDAAGEVVLATGEARSSDSPGSAQARDVAMIRGSARVGSVANVDGPELEVVVGERESVALAGVTTLRSTLFKLGTLALMVSSALGALVAWRISLPIRRLTTTVRRIGARGRIEERIDLPRARGEIGVLAAAFRTMMDNLRAAQEEALVQSRRAFLGEVAANIAHEVRTPLSVLKTSAQLLARQELPAAEQRQLAMNVAAEVDRLNGVVTNLVDLARPKPVQYRTEPLVGVLERAVSFFRPQAAKLGVEISHRMTDASVCFHGSADQLHQVFLNVIQNSLQAMDGPGSVRIDCYSDGGWATVEVEDAGPGFSPEGLSEAFAPFRTTKQDGTGLGLAISRRIVEEHGGTISVANGAGGGACVRIRLPRRREGI